MKALNNLVNILGSNTEEVFIIHFKITNKDTKSVILRKFCQISENREISRGIIRENCNNQLRKSISNCTVLQNY